MPIYEYKCEGCGETFEVIQKFADEPVTVHEKCGGHVHRLMSAPSFQFKGSGWYVTDYAKGSGSGPAKPDSHKEDSGKSESKGEKSESWKSESGKSDGSSKTESSGKSSGDTGTKPESKSDSKPASSSSSKND
ncbi:MAG: FmdB family zinc ribbon protein [Bryobacteraceae bacterium]